MLNESGREFFLYRVCSGESCILTTSCLLGGSSYPAEGITMEEVTVFSIAAEDFFRNLDDSKAFRQFVFSNFPSRLANVIRRMEELTSGDIDRRLARILLSARGNQVAKTHQDLAVELGTAREVITRHLKRFAQNGWIRIGRGMVELTDRPAIELFVGGQKRL
jgi:CRP/FNR family transcriptional regulator